VISHLDTVRNCANAVLPEIESKLSDQSRNKFNKLQSRVDDMQIGLERIRDLVIKLRTFSRLDEGESKQVNIEECIESVLTLLQHRLQKRIKVIRRYDDNNIVHCYPGPLNQVFMNVISNAIDAIEGQGEISISTQRKDLMFTIAIADNGSGIADAVRDRIFEPFFTTKPVGQGTGLGLSISYSIVKKHGGEFEICNREGGGTEMIISIPQNETVINQFDDE
jgi:two-component system NtrC family sensor kinase